MNLAIDAWIPIVWSDGSAGLVGLQEAFERGEEIRDLAVRPHERIALMRLLICIAQAALDGPADDDDWKACFPRIATSARDYLRCWQGAFELFGDGPRFLQIANLKRPMKKSGVDDDEGNLVSKLDIALATGNNTTLFDNAGGSERAFTPAQLALNLLSFQCFSPGGRIGVSMWDGVETQGKGSSKHAPCLAESMLHALLRGEHLLDSVHQNLITKRQVEQLYGRSSWGKPIWEMWPQRADDSEAVRNANRTYLGRLLPLARAIFILDDPSLILANGISYGSYEETGWREPTSTVVVRTIKDEPVRRVLRGSVERAAWRELHALAVRGVGDKPGGPAALENISDEKPFDLWVGGLVADKAKPIDTIESVFHVPAEMLHDDGHGTYEKGVELAEQNEFRLRRAVSEYHNQLGDNLDRPEMKTRRQQIQGHAVAQFWTEVELAVPHLLQVAEHPEQLGLNNEWRNTEWGKAVFSAMRAAFERSCPHETPRQMRAYAAGLHKLLSSDQHQTRSAHAGAENDSNEGDEL